MAIFMRLVKLVKCVQSGNKDIQDEADVKIRVGLHIVLSGWYEYTHAHTHTHTHVYIFYTCMKNKSLKNKLHFGYQILRISPTSIQNQTTPYT